MVAFYKGHMKIIFIVIIFISATVSAEYYYENNKKVALIRAKPNNQSSSLVLIDYYESDKGNLLGVSNQLIVKVSVDNDLPLYINDFNLIVIKEMSKNLYLLEVTDKSLTIETANRLNEKQDIEYSHPNFIKKSMRR